MGGGRLRRSFEWFVGVGRYSFFSFTCRYLYVCVYSIVKQLYHITVVNNRRVWPRLLQRISPFPRRLIRIKAAFHKQKASSQNKHKPISHPKQ